MPPSAAPGAAPGGVQLRDHCHLRASIGASMAARMPAHPAPTTRTSKEGSITSDGTASPGSGAPASGGASPGLSAGVIARRPSGSSGRAGRESGRPEACSTSSPRGAHRPGGPARNRRNEGLPGRGASWRAGRDATPAPDERSGLDSGRGHCDRERARPVAAGDPQHHRPLSADGGRDRLRRAREAPSSARARCARSRPGASRHAASRPASRA